jgi:hypothetical protein
MQIITRKYKVYSFKELSEESKDKVIEKLYDINVDYSGWYEFTLENIVEKIEHLYGLTFPIENACFDFQGQYWEFYIDANHDGSGHYIPYTVKDYKTFLKYLKSQGISQKTCKLLEDGHIDVRIDMQHYGGGSGANYIEIQELDRSLSKTEYSKLEDLLTGLLKDIANNALTDIRNDYDSLTSRDAIVETIEANDYTFLEDGTMFN